MEIMKKDKNSKTDLTLRRRAEERLRAARPMKDFPGNEADRERLIHELQVHQIELEMQNEELRMAQLEIEKSKEKFLIFTTLPRLVTSRSMRRA